MFANALYDNEFPLDPIGSFKITKKISPSVEDAFRRAIEIGALVHIGRSPMDVPAMIAGERFRLSFMVCPSYKLPLRNYRHVRLEPAGIDKNISRQYRIRPEIAQLPLRFDEDEDIETIEN
jgi:hypothetical protein